MEEEVCLYQKYGFCKYKERCTKRHLDEECQYLGKCKSKKICHKRHPKPCKSYAQQTNCSFGDKCEYSHEEKDKLPEEVKLKDRIAELEKSNQRKVISRKQNGTCSQRARKSGQSHES